MCPVRDAEKIVLLETKLMFLPEATGIIHVVLS